MYPNPQDVLPLPPHPDPDQYRKRARELARACRAHGNEVDTWAVRWVGDLDRLQPATADRVARDLERRARQVADFARARMGAECTLSQAQFVIARAHGFPSWPALVRHIGACATASPVAAYERAADAIVTGDLPTLDALLREAPDLVRARSGREHQATLLHYVSANGVENFRQKTPRNIVSIARRLLDAGAEVDAEADVYGGGATTLGLVVTSAHPRQAGVQLELADLLLERGARVDAGIVRSCLMNGCPKAARHMAQRGADVGPREAAGIGRLDILERALAGGDGLPIADAAAALLMASWYGELDAVTLLLDHGVEAGVPDPDDGGTALHIAAWQGNAALAELLLARGAPVNLRDTRFGTPPLVWALHAWLAEGRGNPEGYRAVVRMLAEAGAEVQAAWIDDDRLRADPELHAILAGRT